MSLAATNINPFGGNVGVGTTSPRAKLDVNGDLHVAGNLTVDGEVQSPTGQRYTTAADLEAKIDMLNELGVVAIDIDGNVYETVRIGSQIWMAENLKVAHFPDGTDIPMTTQEMEWISMTDTGGVCFGPITLEHLECLYYNWEAAANACPDGWHHPTDDDWKELELFVGIDYTEIDNEGNRGTLENAVKLMDYTEGYITGDNMNQTGFSAILDDRVSSGGLLTSDNMFMIFWASTPGLIRDIRYFPGGIFRGFVSEKMGYTVRCIKD
jgi:uncharacterized protein (TIGR02145 family)